MGKPDGINRFKKMTDLVTERRKSSHHLKRSKSVRASLRFIGTKFLNHKNSTNDHLQKTPSLSSLNEYNTGFFHDNESSCQQFTVLPEFYAKEPVETILKTPMVKIELKNKLKKSDKIKISTPPAVIAPKAAQILQIPIKEKSEPLTFRDENVFFGNGFVCESGQGFCSQRINEFEYRHNRFGRNTLRLSITASKRKNNARNSSFADCQKLPKLPGDLDMEVASVPINRGLPPAGHKPSKKEAKLIQQRLERLARVNIHLHALFAAVEHGHLEKARTILESTDVDVNRMKINRNDGY